jgi:hypothetical protein
MQQFSAQVSFVNLQKITKFEVLKFGYFYGKKFYYYGFALLKNSRPDLLWPTQSPIQRVEGAFPLE